MIAPKPGLTSEGLALSLIITPALLSLDFQGHRDEISTIARLRVYSVKLIATINTINSAWDGKLILDLNKSGSCNV